MLRRSISTQRRRRRDDGTPSSPVESGVLKPGLLRGQVEAWTNLVARYRRDAPVVLQHGIYRQLDRGQDEIRILTILPSNHPDATVCCTIATLPLPDAAALGYDALSYCWGTGAETRTVLVNDVLRDVTVSLEAALRRLRSRTEPVRLWADALCINQADTRERNHQVQLMQRIYRHAAVVRVSLDRHPSSGGGISSSDDDDPPLPPRSIQLVAALKARRARWQRKNAYTPALEAGTERVRLVSPWSSSVVSDGFQTLAGAANDHDDHLDDLKSFHPAQTSTAAAPPAPVATGQDNMLGLSEADVLDLAAFFAHPWWRRIWVVQEVHLARACFVHVAGGQGGGKEEDEGEAVEFADVVRAAERLWNVLDSLESMATTREHQQQQQQRQQQPETGEGEGGRQRLVVSELRARTAGARAFLRILAVCHLEPSERGSLVRILAEARALLASDPRDQVFGLIGLSPFLGEVDPDYSLAPEQAFVKAAGKMMRSTQSLDVLFQAGLQLNNRGSALPSWVPDWTVHESGQSLRHITIRNLYSAAGVCKPSFAVRKSGELSVKSIMVDTVDQTTAWGAWEHGSGDVDDLLSSIVEQTSRLRRPGRRESGVDGLSLEDVFAGMRTIAMDVVRSGGPLQRGFDSAMKYYGLDDDEKQSVLLGLDRVVIENNRSKEPRSIGRFLKDELAPNVRGQRLCSTKSGRLCLLPEISKSGDTIHILAGLSMPAVLRPCGRSKYQLIGVCYLDGLMDNKSVGVTLEIGGSSKLQAFKTIIIA